MLDVAARAPSFRRGAGAAIGFGGGGHMSKLELPLLEAEMGALQVLPGAEEKTHPQDRVFSGLFGHGRVVELLKNAEGYAYGHRIQFENGMQAELLITDVATRH